MREVVLPCDACRGMCCENVPMTRRELKTIRRKHGIPAGARAVESPVGGGVMVVKPGTANVCAFLMTSGRCGVYDDRSLVRRLYGKHPDMPCAYLHPAACEDAAVWLAVKQGLLPVSALVRKRRTGDS